MYGDDTMIPHLVYLQLVILVLLGRVPIGWEGELPLPSSHTTVRTGPYTAVHVDRCIARC
jgi:hypothetical protein